MKISTTVIARAALVAAAFAVAAGFLPGDLTPVGTPTAHTVAAAQPGDWIVPVGTPTAHGNV